jgi:hypothetical protein
MCFCEDGAAHPPRSRSRPASVRDGCVPRSAAGVAGVNQLCPRVRLAVRRASSVVQRGIVADILAQGGLPAGNSYLPHLGMLGGVAPGVHFRDRFAGGLPGWVKADESASKIIGLQCLPNKAIGSCSDRAGTANRSRWTGSGSMKLSWRHTRGSPETTSERQGRGRANADDGMVQDARFSIVPIRLSAGTCPFGRVTVSRTLSLPPATPCLAQSGKSAVLWNTG